MPFCRYEPFSIGEVDAPIIVLHNFRMNSLVREINKIWFIVLPLDELNCISGEKICDVSVRLHLFAIFIDLRIEVRPLSFETHPPIKTRTLGVVVSHVPLADESGCITRLLQQ